jgi:hypothetical protein
MTWKHVTAEACFDYATGEMAAEERTLFESHIRECAQCRLHVEQYQEILREGLPSIADQMMDETSSGQLPWSIEAGEKKLFAALDRGNNAQIGIQRGFGFQAPANSEKLQPKPDKFALSSRVKTALAIAATIVFAAWLGDGIYRLGVKDGKTQIATVEAPRTDDGALRLELAKLTADREQLQANLLERAREATSLRSQIDQQREQSQVLEAKLASANQQSADQIATATSQRDELNRKMEDQQSLLAETQRKLESVQQASSGDNLRAVSLENRIEQLTLEVKDKNATIDDRDKMLASDRDIRDLMGARDLYIAEVYDVGENGKKKKPYGRVFYTKGKSLIFYGYDFDQQPGVVNATTFQAWGMRGPDMNKALKLGIMYVDNSTNKRWFLRFDDPKVLAEINAVFVTMEPNGESRVPKGKQVLFAYLKEEANHP